MTRIQGVDQQWAWAVNLQSLSNAMKKHCIESIVFGETSEVGRRIWRMLLLQNKMEQRQVWSTTLTVLIDASVLVVLFISCKQIEKLAMVKMKEARTTLYQLFERRYICLQVRAI